MANRPPESHAGPSKSNSRLSSVSNHSSRPASPRPDAKGQQNVTDIYRPTTSSLQKSIAPWLPPILNPSATSLPTLLALDPTSYQTRLANKSLILTGTGAASVSTVSPLVRGKKRNRGWPEERTRTRREVEAADEERERAGLVGVRKAKKRIRESGAVMGRGTRVDYNAILPLHYLHLSYLSQLLALPPLPTPPPPAPDPPNHYHHLPLPPGLSRESLQSRLIHADFTGIHLHILSSRSPSLTGLSGIVIEETSSTFRLVGQDSKVRVIPKDGTLFRISFPAYSPPGLEKSQDIYNGGIDGDPPEPVDWEEHCRICPQVAVEVLGSAFGYRSGVRAGRQFKPMSTAGSGWGEEWVEGEWKGVLDVVERNLKRGSRLRDVSGQQGGKSRTPAKTVGIPGDQKRRRGKARRKDPPAWGRLEAP